MELSILKVSNESTKRLFIGEQKTVRIYEKED